MKGELGTRPPRGGDGKLIADLVRELEELAQLGHKPAPDTAVLFALDRRGSAITLERIDASEASEEYLADAWGGGRYQVRMEGEGKYLGAINVRVAGPPGAGARALDQGEAPSSIPAAPGPSDDLRQELRELHRKLAELAPRVESPPPGSNQPAEMMRMAGEMAMAMVAPMQAMMEAMAKTKPGRGGGDEVSLFIKGLTLGRTLGEANDGGGFGPVLMKAFDRLEGLQQMAGANPPPLPPPGAPGPQVTTGPSHPYLPAIAPYADQLLRLAAGQSDPGLWAAVIEDRAPDLVDALRSSTDASRSQLLDALVAYRPDLAPHRPWLDLLVGELVTPDAEESQDVREPVD